MTSNTLLRACEADAHRRRGSTACRRRSPSRLSSRRQWPQTGRHRSPTSRRAARRGGQHLDLAEREGHGGAGRGADAAAARGLAVPGFLRRFLQEPRRRRRRRRAEGAVARLRLRRRRRAGHRRHQQPRDRRRRRDRGQFLRRLEAQGRTGRHGHQDRPCGAEGRSEAEEADGREIRRFQQDAHRRLGDGDRQSVRPRRHGDGRHRLGAQPRHQCRSL